MILYVDNVMLICMYKEETDLKK